MNRFSLLLLTAVLTGVTSCIAPKSHVDQKFQGVAYTDIRPVESPQPVRLTVVGQTNGKENKRASIYWREQVVATLLKTRVLRAQPDTGASLHITINNLAAIGSAASKGAATGLTFGAVGTAVTDEYEMIVQFDTGSGEVIRKSYRHAIHTVIGNAKPPPGLESMSPEQATSVVAQDLVLHFLKDLQAGQR